jgi:hypothetical protein
MPGGKDSSLRRYRKQPLRFTWIIQSSALLRSVGWIRIDVLCQPIGPIFKGQVSKIGCPETSVLNQPMLRNNPEDGRIRSIINH